VNQIKHQNNGACPKCKEIFGKYHNFNPKVRSWFVIFQAAHPEAHISCAGRGHADQEIKRSEGLSKASYGQSAHNYNCAIDVFVSLSQKDIYDKKWFNEVLAPEIPYFLNWYGAPDSRFHELPHIELRDWRRLKATGMVSLVEPYQSTGNIA
jgi:hypothetical protein